MLPPDPAARKRVYDRVLAAGASLHAALENHAVKDAQGCAALEETLVAQALVATPFGGRYEKDGRPPAVTNATEAALLALGTL